MNKLQDVALLRCLAVISLVAWHSYCSYICWNIADTPMSIWYTRLFKILTPDANMPLFTFISGYLFCYLLIFKDKYLSFHELLTNKVNRLLIPFLILGTLTNLTEYGKNISDIFYGKPSHLWYCLMLFYCFIACWLIEKKLGKRWNIATMCVSTLVVIGYKGNGLGPNTPLGLFMPVYYYCYFYAGFLVFFHKDIILKNVKKYFPLIVLAFACSLMSGRLILFSSLLYILIVWRLIYARILPPPILNVVNTIGVYSFGIYVFHQWIIWNITRIPCCIDVLYPYMTNHDILFPLLLTITVFLISMLFTHISLKTRLGRYLLT